MPILISLLKALIKLPVWFQLKIGYFLGLLFFLIARQRKKVIAANLKACFPDKSDQEIKKLTFKNCLNCGLGIVEIGMTFWLSDSRLKAISSLSGTEHIEKAREAGQSIVFLPGHFTSMFLAGRILHQYERLTLIYYSQNNPHFSREMKKGFERHGFNAIENRNVREMMKSVQNQVSLWLPCDQDYGVQVFAPLFNQRASTITTPARIGKNKNVAYLPVFYQRKGQRYEVTIEPALQNYPVDGVAENETANPKWQDEANAKIFNQMLEKHILKNLDQYLWAHKRFKTQPESTQSIY